MSDFHLNYYRDECPLKLGDIVTSPAVDGCRTVEFLGSGRVVAIGEAEGIGYFPKMHYDVTVRIIEEGQSEYKRLCES